MKCLIVYQAGGKLFGSEVGWKRSGSGSYRETTPITVPQTRDELDKFAQEYGYSVEWRGPELPASPPPAPHATPTPETAASLT
ncbi:MAG: hypothetical protein JWN86_1892 [Planctomycetota bacterium]|nr:hypothetical protein [Planctomycetota bacterium]